MVQYNFHKKIDRQNSSSVKWGLRKDIFGSEDVLPMWVADMEFQPPKEVTEAIQNRVDHGIYGYTYVPASVADSIQKWLATRHNWEIQQEWVSYSPGVVPSIGTAIRAFTNPGDKIFLQSPVYTPFFEMISKNDRVVVNAPLLLRNSQFEINFDQFEDTLKEGPKLFLLCNPHNPGGRVWTKEELTTIAELCVKYNCLILSDEIHSDLIYKPSVHTPIASIDKKYQDHIITFIAPSKTFNLAGLKASAVITSNPALQKTFITEQGKQGISSLNTFGIIGMEAAYRHGHSWLDELLDYLNENINITTQFIDENLPQISYMKPDGTYLIWLDCRKTGLSDEELRNRLLLKGKIALEPGDKYGPGGEGFVRINVGCQRDLLIDGLERLKVALYN